MEDYAPTIFGMQRKDGSVKRASEILNKCDFVEAAAFVDIVVGGDEEEKTRVDIQHAPEEMIRLWSARGKGMYPSHINSKVLMEPARIN